MTMNDGQGSQIVVTVPVTWIPIDLTTQATKSAVLSSPTFRRMLASGYLRLMREEEAMEIMATTDAQKELMRIYNRAQDLTVDSVNMPQEAKKAQVEGSGEISGFAMNIVMATDLEEDQVMTTLRNNESTLTNEDFKYIAQNSTYARVKAYAAEKVEK